MTGSASRLFPKTFFVALSVILLSTAAASASQGQKAESTATEGTPTATGAQTIYTIKQGDTLWDISEAVLKDPFLWPFIWKANPSIENPDLIFPNNKLTIPNLTPIEQVLQQPQAEHVAETTAVAPSRVDSSTRTAKSKPTRGTPRSSGIYLPTDQPKPIVDKYAMLTAGFINNGDVSGAIITDAEGRGKTIMGYGDGIYIKFNNPDDVRVGDKYLISRALDEVKHPITRAKFGKMHKGVGIAEITAKEPDTELVKAKITLSSDGIAPNDTVAPYQEPVPVYSSSTTRAKDIVGYVLQLFDGKTISGTHDIVYIDKGSAEGVDIGDTFVVKRAAPGETMVVVPQTKAKGLPMRAIGEIQVFLVKEHSSTAIARSSTDAMGIGDVVEFKK